MTSESLRDTLAAAALTGLIANGDYSVESTPLLAYRMADAMLRERAQDANDDPPLAAESPQSYAKADENRANLISVMARLAGADEMTHTPQPQPTPGEGSVPREGT